MKRNAWLWYLAVAVGVGQYYFVSAVGSVPDEGLFTAIGWSSVVAVAVGIGLTGRRRGPVAVTGWALVLVALILYLVGDLVYASLERSSGFVEFPSSADWLYLAMYPTLVAGVLLIRCSVAPGRDRVAFLDALAIGVAAFGVIGAVYLYGYLIDDTFGRDAQIVASAYPLLDVVVTMLAAWLVVRSVTPPACLQLVAAACVAIVVGNAVFNVAAISFSFESGGVADLGWLTFMVLLGAAALHPSAGEPDGGPAPRRDVVPARRSACSAVVPAVAVVFIPVAHLRWADGEYLTATGVTTAIAVAALTVRVVLTTRSHVAEAPPVAGEPFADVPVIDAPMTREALTPFVVDETVSH